MYTVRRKKYTMAEREQDERYIMQNLQAYTGCRYYRTYKPARYLTSRLPGIMVGLKPFYSVELVQYNDVTSYATLLERAYKPAGVKKVEALRSGNISYFLIRHARRPATFVAMHNNKILHEKQQAGGQVVRTLHELCDDYLQEAGKIIFR